MKVVKFKVLTEKYALLLAGLTSRLSWPSVWWSQSEPLLGFYVFSSQQIS